MRALAVVGAIGVGIFVVVCGAAQFLRTDLHWAGAPLSMYLIGPGGGIVKFAYCALALGLGAIGMAFHRNLQAQARSGAPPLLFVTAGVALVVTALSETSQTATDGALQFTHNLAALTTFVCVTVAMLLQSWWLRKDARWQPVARFALSLATAAFAALWIYMLVHVLPRGLIQKIVIALILTWLGWAAHALLQRSRTPAP